MNKNTKKIAAVLTQTGKLNPNHYNTLMGERPFGSKWGKEMIKEDYLELDWTEEPYHAPCKEMLPFCTYFIAYLPEGSKGNQNCLSLSVCDHKRVKIQEGEHGTELVSDQVKPMKCSTAWMIIGPAQDQDGNPVPGQMMVWTSFPGDLFSPLPKDWNGDLNSLDPDTNYAVKGI